MSNLKKLLVFCDGTGMDGNLADGPFGDTGGAAKQYPTNVLRLSRAVKQYATDGRRQIIFYQSGVGSEADFNENPAVVTITLQALGDTVASKIRDAYAFISQNFESGDEICIFGGAYCARKLSGLIDRIGLLDRTKLGFFYEIWKELVDGKEPTIPPGTLKPSIKCVGIWDTVGSVLGDIDALSIKDTDLPNTIDIALHALSLHENRKMFLPTLWTVPQHGLRANQVLKQLWFPGSNPDVGGGYEHHELADISLFWMVGEVSSIIDLDLDFSDKAGSQIQTRIETRLESDQIARDSEFHESIKFSPSKLEDMVTLNILRNKFGADWEPSIPPMNTFEKYCKEHWGVPPVIVESIQYENFSESFGSGLHWISVDREGFFPPENAIHGGIEDVGGVPLYISRAKYRAGIHPGKCRSGHCWFGYDFEEIEIVKDYQCLIGPESAVKWVDFTGKFFRDKLREYRPVTAGIEYDRIPLYIAKAEIGDGVQCGKVKEDSLALIPYNGKENSVESYWVLVYSELLL